MKLPNIVIERHGGLLYEHMPYQGGKPFGQFSMFGTTPSKKQMYNSWPCILCGNKLNDIAFKAGPKKQTCNDCFKSMRAESDNLASKARYYFKLWPKIIEDNLEWIL